MSHARRADRDHEHDHVRTDDYDGRDDHADRHPALTPLVIDLIPEQTRAELEASIDEPLSVEREAVWEDRENEGYHSITVGTVGAGKTFSTKTELLADLREDGENESDAASDSDSGGDYYD